ncbi:MAG: hypothetical protein WKF80_04235, partial [Thermomicrobiales bacterium]
AMASDAAGAGCSPEPTAMELEEADRKATEALQTLRRAEDRRHDLVAALEREREAQEVVDARAAELDVLERERDAVTAEWAAWLVITSLPSSLPPRGVLAFLDLIDSGRQRVEAEATATGEVTARLDTVERVESALAGVAASLAPEEDVSDSVVGHAGSSSPGPGAAGSRMTFGRGEPTVGAIRALAVRLAADRDRQRQREAYRETIRVAEGQIAAIAGDGDLGPALALLAGGGPDHWRAQIDEATREERVATEALVATRREAMEASVRRRALETSTEVANLELERNAMLAERGVTRREEMVLAMAVELLREMVARVERERQPEVLRQASSLFERITGGRYARVFRAAGASGDLVIEAGDGSVRPPEALSRGTLEQLYLALRLGLAAAFSPRVGRLPLVMDDVLVNFDPERALGVARALQDVARERQVLLFTSQPATLEVMRSVEGTVAHFAMARHGTGGEWVDR